MRENELGRYTRYNKSRPDRDHGKIPLAEREFIVWDGEGPRDTGYSLLGNSVGEEICYPTLKTRECLDLLLQSAETNPNTIHVSYGFGYDVSNILRELSWRHLAALHKYGRTFWEGYHIEHIPRKWFRVEKGGVHLKIYDVFGYFQSSLVKALESWKIGPFAFSEKHSIAPSTSRAIPTVQELTSLSEASIISVFKNLRGDFMWKDMPSIRQYMHLELKYTKLLMEALRETFVAAGYVPTSWHGPAGLARQAFRRHKVYEAKAITPPDVQIASRYGFFGGRFEQFIGGHVNARIYVVDINSAYPYYCAQLPNLAAGRWARTNHYIDGLFGIYRIAYKAKPDSYRPFPLPFRDKHHNVVFPYRTEGWYWNPEASLVANDPDAIFKDGWVFYPDNVDDRPFAWIQEYYRRRQLLKRTGNPAQLTFKLIINSAYGVLAQRSGYDRKKNKPPETHQLEWAGWITSACRAQLFREAVKCGDDLVSMDTDGITSLKPFTWLEESDRLGGWEKDEYDDGVFWQSGIYALKKDGQWLKNKTRGIPADLYSASDLIRHCETLEPLRLSRNTFVGYGLALNGRRNELNTWKTEDVEYKLGGGGKRQHVRPHGKCPKRCGDGIHRFALPALLYGPFGSCHSEPHTLPWLGNGIGDVRLLMDDLTYYTEEEYYREIALPELALRDQDSGARAPH